MSTKNSTRPNLLLSAPHIRRSRTTLDIMAEVLVALLPAAIWACWLFGWRAVWLLAVTVGCCCGAEWLSILARKEKGFDGSAAVTGALLALSLPVGTPLWAAALAGIFSIVVIKQLFGGIGHNLLNPAMAGRALLMVVFPQILGDYAALDATTTATPLANLSHNEFSAMFLGVENGSLGETSALLILLGGAYLYLRGVIRLRVPLTYLGIFAAAVWALGGEGWFTGPVTAHVLSGGVLMGAFFIVTDFATKPTTTAGEILYAAGAGLLTALLRLYGPYPEGVCFAVLLMNLAAPLLEYLTRPVVYGLKKKEGHAA